MNQYYVVLEVAPQYWQRPEGLKFIYLRTSNNGVIPLDAVTRAQTGTTPLTVNHTGLFPSVTVSFNLAPGTSLSEAAQAINGMQQSLGTPPTIRGFFAGTLLAYQQSLGSEPYLILTALLAVYIVLGILYESLVHPLTIISTLPSASAGAMLALMLLKVDLSVISIIGIVLLIGIVKKNAIMMIDFALVAEREHGMSTTDAIFEACHPAVPADPDDHHGRAVRRPAAGLRDRHRLGVAPAARHHDRRRPDRQPVADPLHHASRLPLAG